MAIKAGTLGLVCLLVGACGGDGDSAPDARVVPDAMVAADAAGSGACLSASTTGGSHKLYLNFESQDLVFGANNDAIYNTHSALPTTGTQTSPPFHMNSANRQRNIDNVVAQVKATLAPFDVEVVTTRPAAAPYTMMVLGGLPSDLGLTGPYRSLCTNGCAATPQSSSLLSLVFDSGTEAVANAVVGCLGVTFGIPLNKENGSCLCFNDPACSPLPQICEIGEEVIVDETNTACGQTGTVDEHLEFKRVFGCRP